MKRRLAILASHPIHYQAPLWRLLAADPELEAKVFFLSDFSLRPHRDPEFDRVIEWNMPLTEGYPYKIVRNAFAVLGELRRDRYDALLVQAWNSAWTWMAVAGAKALGIKTMLRTESPWNQEAGNSGLKALFKRVVLRSFFAMIDAFLFIGEENRQFYLHYGISEKKLFFAPYAVENERFLAAAGELDNKRLDIRDKLDLSREAVVFLAVGKLIPKKRHIDLLRAYEKCSLPGKALIIVGEGALRADLEEYVKERGLQGVRMPGFAGQTEIYPYYSAADVFVFPSGRGETWGLALNEAMCFSLPVVVSDMVGSGRDLVRDGKNGYVFPLGDIEAMAGAMEEMGRDPAKRKNFGKRSFEIVKEYNYEADLDGIKTALDRP